MQHELKTLSMDSAAQVGGVALLAGDRLVCQARVQGAAGHAVLLPERLSGLLVEAAWSCAELDLIVVTNGPGSFAGLRIALGCAKGIALVHGTPVVGVSNLDLLAAGTGQREGWLSVVVDARRGELFAALYQLEKGQPHRCFAPDSALAPQQWADTLAAMPELRRQPICLTGSGLGPYAELFQQALAGPVTMTTAECWIGDPFLLGRLGQRLYLQQQAMAESRCQETAPPAGPVMTTLLDYQRRPDAEAKKQGLLCLSAP
ncbi:MAG: tRNA (adenosine(37)-N6)-threonylcarbamoyltransferase complex dimerization subunit type 1 TsaB [Magnetococcus sp. MYC-9]